MKNYVLRCLEMFSCAAATCIIACHSPQEHPTPMQRRVYAARDRANVAADHVRVLRRWKDLIKHDMTETFLPDHDDRNDRIVWALAVAQNYNVNATFTRESDYATQGGFRGAVFRAELRGSAEHLRGYAHAIAYDYLRFAVDGLRVEREGAGFRARFRIVLFYAPPRK
jgi:hypothetical protein